MKLDRALLARVGRLRLASAGPVRGTRQGERGARAVGGGLTFADHRAYHPGDDLRHVDWNVYGRLGTLLVRLTHEDRDQRVRIVVDASGSMGLGERSKLDHAGDLAACLALLGLAARDEVSLSTIGGEGGDRLVEGHDTHALPAMLRALEETRPGRSCDTRQALLKAARGSTVDRTLLLSDLLLPAEELDGLFGALAATSAHPVVLHVLGELDLDPPLDHAVRLQDAETGEELLVGGGPEARAAYARALGAWREGLSQRAARRGVRLVPAETTTPPERLLLEGLRRAKVVTARSGR